VDEQQIWRDWQISGATLNKPENIAIQGFYSFSHITLLRVAPIQIDGANFLFVERNTSFTKTSVFERISN
jgi:hypothetical protein